MFHDLFFAQVHVKYERYSDDESSLPDDNSVVSDDVVEMSDPAIISFPLKSELHEIELENLQQGWYVVCAEARRKGQTLEEECFRAKIMAPSDNSGMLSFDPLGRLTVTAGSDHCFRAYSPSVYLRPLCKI